MSVPDELMRVYDEGLMKAGEDDDPVRVALAAVLDRHEAMVLERKAREFETCLTGTDGPWDRAINQVIRDLLAPSEPPEIARGGSDAH